MSAASEPICSCCGGSSARESVSEAKAEWGEMPPLFWFKTLILCLHGIPVELEPQINRCGLLELFIQDSLWKPNMSPFFLGKLYASSLPLAL